MRALAILALAITAFFAAPAFSAERHWQFVAELNFPHETRAKFRETRSSKLLRKPAQQTGTLWIEGNGDFVMQVLEPRNELRKLSEQRLSLTRGKKHRSITLDRDKGSHQLLLSIVDVLEGNVQQLKKRFDIVQPASDAGAASARNDDWLVTLTPIDATLRNSMQRLILRGRGTALKSLRTERNAKSWQEIEIFPATSSNSSNATGD